MCIYLCVLDCPNTVFQRKSALLISKLRKTKIVKMSHSSHISLVLKVVIYMS